MKKLILASTLLLAVPQANATFLDAITGANGANITFEDNSREQFVDVDSNGSFNAGDRLEGFLKFDAFSPPATNTNNDLYVTFSQTFGADFEARAGSAGGTIYSGSFSQVELNFIDYTGVTDFITADLSGGVAAAIASIEANGSIAFSAGLVEPEDYFAFETTELFAGSTDFIGSPVLLESIATTNELGNFAAGLSITANNIPVIFNRVIQSSFNNGNSAVVAATGLAGVYGTIPTGPFANTFAYDIGIVNGNFGGTCENPNATPACSQTIQNLTGGLVDNADAVLNATRIPEPTSLALLGLGLLGLGYTKRKA